MPGETFTQLGYTAHPFDWCPLVMLWAFIPISWKIAGRPLRITWVLSCVATLCALVRMPASYLMAIELVCISVGVVAISSKMPSLKGRSPFLIALPFTGMFPILAFSVLFNRMNFQDLSLQEGTIEVSTQHKTLTLRRDLLDVTYEKSWLGHGLTWGFYVVKERGFVLVPEQCYWTGRGFENGEEIARRVVAWAGSKPRYVINGVSDRKWHDPRKPFTSAQ